MTHLFHSFFLGNRVYSHNDIDFPHNLERKFLRFDTESLNMVSVNRV